MLYTLHKLSKILKWYKNQNNILSFSMQILMFIHWWVRNNLIESKLIMQFLDLGVSALMVWIVGKLLLHIFFCDKLLDVDEAEIQCKWLEVSNLFLLCWGCIWWLLFNNFGLGIVTFKGGCCCCANYVGVLSMGLELRCV